MNKVEVEEEEGLVSYIRPMPVHPPLTTQTKALTENSLSAVNSDVETRLSLPCCSL